MRPAHFSPPVLAQNPVTQAKNRREKSAGRILHNCPTIEAYQIQQAQKTP